MKKYFLLLPFAALLSCKKSSTNVQPSTGSTTVGGTTTTVPKTLLTKESHALTHAYGTTAYAISYTYDASNMLTKMADDDTEVPLVYNSSGLLTSIGKSGNDQDFFTFTYDASGNLTDATELEYDGNSKLDNTTYLKYAVTSGKVTTIQVYTETKALKYTYNYTYDASGNITKVTLNDAKGTLLTSTVNTYGTHNNANLSTRNKFLYNPLDDGTGVNTNELMSTTSKDSFGTITTITHKYTYTNNYPVSDTITFTYSNDPKGTTTDAVQYQYSNL